MEKKVINNQDENQVSENQNVRNFYKQLEVDNKNLKKRVENLKLQIEFYMYSEQLETVISEIQNKENLKKQNLESENGGDESLKRIEEKGEAAIPLKVSTGKESAKK